MTRQLFTIRIIQLLSEMIAAGDNPVIDYVMRGTIEQVHIFLKSKGLSKCDGIKKQSDHQLALAMDIYLSDTNDNIQFTWITSRALKWHTRWEELGGKPMVAWDQGHFA
jgi:hypothetical protein